jgi:hypothetical protein
MQNSSTGFPENVFPFLAEFRKEKDKIEIERGETGRIGDKAAGLG